MTDVQAGNNGQFISNNIYDIAVTGVDFFSQFYPLRTNELTLTNPDAFKDLVNASGQQGIIMVDDANHLFFENAGTAVAFQSTQPALSGSLRAIDRITVGITSEGTFVCNFFGQGGQEAIARGIAAPDTELANVSFTQSGTLEGYALAEHRVTRDGTHLYLIISGQNILVRNVKANGTIQQTTINSVTSGSNVNAMLNNDDITKLITLRALDDETVLRTLRTVLLSNSTFADSLLTKVNTKRNNATDGDADFFREGGQWSHWLVIEQIERARTFMESEKLKCSHKTGLLFGVQVETDTAGGIDTIEVRVKSTDLL